MSLQGICIKDEKIKTVKQWLKSKSVRDIQVFFGFTNFYQQFIQIFSRIATSLISMLKTIRNTGPATNPKETKSEASRKNVIIGGEATNQTNSTKKKNRQKRLSPKIW